MTNNPAIDDFVRNHLAAWVKHNLPTSEWNKSERNMLRYVENNPETITERNLGWWQIYDEMKGQGK